MYWILFPIRFEKTDPRYLSRIQNSHKKWATESVHQFICHTHTHSKELYFCTKKSWNILWSIFQFNIFCVQINQIHWIVHRRDTIPNYFSLNWSWTIVLIKLIKIEAPNSKMLKLTIYSHLKYPVNVLVSKQFHPNKCYTLCNMYIKMNQPT